MVRGWPAALTRPHLTRLEARHLCGPAEYPTLGTGICSRFILLSVARNSWSRVFPVVQIGFAPTKPRESGSIRALDRP
jgi:hypothetical protein